MCETVNIVDKPERVAVLMSTYNGEQYINQQIDSILNQDGVDVDLYIRDDGSSDSTIDIIKRYAKQRNIIIIQSEANLGPGQSFMTILYHVAAMRKYNYYAFADQDDIWLPEKLKIAIENLQDYIKIPALYGSNRIIFEGEDDKKLLFGENFDSSLQRCISKNKVAGCTMVFNDALARQIVSHDMPAAEILDYRLHDAWVWLVALVTGKAIYDSDSYILYRIHRDNTVGIKKITLREKIKRIFKKGNGRTERSNLRKKTAETLLEYYPIMDCEKKGVLEPYAYYQDSWKVKWKFLKSTQLIQASGENLLVFRMKILLNFI